MLGRVYRFSSVGVYWVLCVYCSDVIEGVFGAVLCCSISFCLISFVHVVADTSDGDDIQFAVMS